MNTTKVEETAIVVAVTAAVVNAVTAATMLEAAASVPAMKTAVVAVVSVEET